MKSAISSLTTAKVFLQTIKWDCDGFNNMQSFDTIIVNGYKKQKSIKTGTIFG